MRTKTILAALLTLLFFTTIFLGACDKGENDKINLGTMTDTRDGQTYLTVYIGSQTWMADNLNYITNESWWYDHNSQNGETYGRLYSWEAAMDACPNGWHLPSDDEWKELEI